MVTISCLICGACIHNCVVSNLNNLNMIFPSCNTCYNNGTYRQRIKAMLGLVDSANLTSLNTQFQQYKTAHPTPLTAFKTLEAQFEQYKKRFPLDYKQTLSLFINDSTYDFMKKFEQFKRNVEKDEPKLLKKVQETILRMQATAQDFIKKEIIKETKYLAKLIEEESAELQRLKLEVKNTCEKLRTQLSQDTWQVKQINQHMALFDKKINKYNTRVQICNKLKQQGQKIISQEVKMNPQSPQLQNSCDRSSINAKSSSSQIL